MDSTAFQNCPKLKSLELSSKNKTFYIKNNCLITKKDKALVYAIQGDKKTMDIPEGVKIIKEYSFSNCEYQTVHIPASVTEIENHAFLFYPFDEPNKKIKDIKISKKKKADVMALHVIDGDIPYTLLSRC